MKVRDNVDRALAAVFLAGEWTEPALLARTQKFLGRSTRRSQQALIGELLEASVPTIRRRLTGWRIS